MTKGRVKKTFHSWQSASGLAGDVALHWDLVDGRVACVGINLVCDPGSSLDVRDLRHIPLGEHFEQGRRKVTRHFIYESERGSPPTVADDEGVPRLRGASRFQMEGRKGPLSDAHYRAVAQDFEVLLRLTRRPTSTLAKQYGVSQPTAARWVMKARNLGLLPKTTPGRARSADEDETQQAGEE